MVPACPPFVAVHATYAHIGVNAYVDMPTLHIHHERWTCFLEHSSTPPLASTITANSQRTRLNNKNTYGKTSA